jgi:hypothetical protein
MTIKPQFVARAEAIARAIESPATTSGQRAELIALVEHHIREADITAPDTIRRLLPFVLALTEGRGGPVQYWLDGDTPPPACHARGAH